MSGPGVEGPATHLALVEGGEPAAALAAKLVAASAWFDVTPMPDGFYAFRVKPEAAIVALVQQHLAEPHLSSAGAALPKEVAGRLHHWGCRDALFADFEDAFLNAYDLDGLGFGERYFHDPETRKAYQAWLKLEIEEVEPPDDSCPECGEGLADATDIADDAVCESCGWSRSGIRRCIRCGGRDGLVPSDAVCSKCRR